MSEFYRVFLSLVYTFSFNVILTNSRTSTLWKLSADHTKIVEASPFRQVISINNGGKGQFVVEDDPVFNIITSTVHYGQKWIKQGVEYYCTNCEHIRPVDRKLDKREFNNTSKPPDVPITTSMLEPDEPLDCGKPVNFTYYDSLVGVINRNRHPNVPEPQVSLIFTKTKKSGRTIEMEIDALERRLKKAKREKPKSVQLYNQIGNFWRVKGDSLKSIECFRRALAVSPHNAEVLLNLARVLFTLQYLDDAIYLTRRSLEVQPPDKGAWQQYFTLGEIFKAYGRYQEATMHLKHTLELKPGFEPAQIALKEMESMPPATIHIYTLVIIICLVLGVLLVILSSVDTIVEGDYSEMKTQRHFNKAMAMRSLKGIGMTQKNPRSKKTSP